MFFGNGQFGFDGGMSHSTPNVDTTTLYKTLNVDKNSSETQIKKAYYLLAKKYHPDKNSGNDQKFKEIQHAYDILGDTKKRKQYNKFGEEGISESGSHSTMDIFDLFSGGKSNKNRQHKGENVNFKLQVTLEDLYNSTKKKLRLSKNIICKRCKGTGSKSFQSTTCRRCDGKGIVIKETRMGPIIQQFQTHCENCSGSGFSVSESDRCKTCKGKKIVKEKKSLEVEIVKGMVHGQNILFRNEADEHPEMESGDVVIELVEKKNLNFRREKLNLFIKAKISLYESLRGGKFIFTHLDGRKIKVNFGGENEIIKPNSFRIIEGEGMPLYKSPYIKGVLVVNFQVEFPDELKINLKEDKILKKIFCVGENVEEVDECENCEFSSSSLEEIKRQQNLFKKKSEIYEEDEEGNDDHTTSCRTQ